MYKGRTIAVVVPAYNEEKLISAVIETMPDYIDKIVIVNDCSKDQTSTVVRKQQEELPELIVLIDHEVNQGVGGAIATGYKWCRDNDIDCAVVMAGDAQMDPADMLALLDPVVSGEVDYSKGNRLITGDAWNQIPKIRYLGNSALSLLTKIASGYWHVADSQCGYTAINKKALQSIIWDQMYKRYGQPNDLLVRLNIFGFRVKDVEVRPVYNIGEKSGIKPIQMIPKLTVFMSKLFLYRMWHKYIIRDFHPLVFFYLVGFFLLLSCIPLAARVIYLWVLEGIIPAINSLAVMFNATIGLQLVMFAMWFDMEYNRPSK
ncbi:MAG: glycosyltransferase family 2 protein [Deltaproteobacteria bacterium]|nr:glycosyltransferase family 2 protein [Deltaproteobacteria bacterium]